ncbi:hypothetical protein PIB30_110848, partial [Stylosanthes scabra]|nr:hypothetical protein [Stylosanthes scabra]
MSSTGRGDDVWWPERLATWYEGWRGRGSPQVLVTVHEGDLRGTQRYYDWFAAAARHGRFLSRAADLADPRWNMAPPGIPADAIYPRDELVMPEDAPAPRRRGDHQPRPRQAAPARGKLSRHKYNYTQLLYVLFYYIPVSKNCPQGHTNGPWASCSILLASANVL